MITTLPAGPDVNGIATDLLPEPTARLVLPKRELASCIIGFFIRDTRGHALPFEKRFNFFAATPFCGISLILKGCTHLLHEEAAMAKPQSVPPLPPITVSGPQRRPSISWNPGPVYGVIIGFFPDAFARLTGLQPGDLAGKTVDADAVLPSNILSAISPLFADEASDGAIDRFQNDLAPLWGRARPKSHHLIRSVTDWSHSVATEAMLSGPGRSARQVQRRIKALAGLPIREIDEFERSALAFSQVWDRASPLRDVTLTDAAIGAGYADQSHMGRRVLRETGFTPATLRRRIETDECFWAYRLYGQSL